MMSRCQSICFIVGRVKYLDIHGDATGAPLQGQAILYFGKDKDKFYNYFDGFGAIVECRKEER